MKLVIVIPSFYPAVVYGGPIFTSYYTCNELSKTISDLKVVTTNANGLNRLAIKPNLYLPLNRYYVKYYNETIISRFSLSLFLGIKHDLENADVVHIQGLFSAPVPIALFWAFKFQKRILLTPHGELGKWCLAYKRASLKMCWLNLLIKPYIKKIVWHATSKNEEKEILDIFPEAKVIVIPNGIYLDDFKNYENLSKSQYLIKFAKKETEISHIIISVGRLQKVKGFDILIKSFKKVLEKLPHSVLFIAGEDEGEKNNLVQLSHAIGVDERVVFVGKIEGQEKIDLFGNADVFALPSHNENFGVVYAEALAAGTPIVASINTPWEAVETANCGRWVPNTPSNTAEAILDLLSRNRIELRQNALQFVEKYDWKKITADFYSLYNELIKGN
jgi:glycosyltransferase involved in cell wall biosynthesis